MYVFPIDDEESGLSAPWYTFGKMVKALFERDPEIDVHDVAQCDPDEDADFSLVIGVKNHEKFIALDRAMPSKKEWGNVILQIDVLDETDADTDQSVELFKTIFAGNPILRDIKTRTDEAGFSWNYCIFEPEVIQFWNDDLSDYSGNWNGLAQDIAEEVFTDKYAMNFCTADKGENTEEQPTIKCDGCGEE